MRRPLRALLALALLAGCASGSDGPGTVRVQVGSLDIDLQSTQGCVDGERCSRRPRSMFRFVRIRKSQARRFVPGV